MESLSRPSHLSSYVSRKYMIRRAMYPTLSKCVVPSLPHAQLFARFIFASKLRYVMKIPIFRVNVDGSKTSASGPHPSVI